MMAGIWSAQWPQTDALWFLQGETSAKTLKNENCNFAYFLLYYQSSHSVVLVDTGFDKWKADCVPQISPVTIGTSNLPKVK